MHYVKSIKARPFTELPELGI